MAIVTGTALESNKNFRVNFDGYVSSVYWQDFFQQKASGTDGVAKARKWRQVQQSSARGFAPAALSCHLEIVAGSPEHVTIQLTQIGACSG